ncbi:GGDEF domain-containing protein [Collimonas silvisoli]|uniref:GGDEF domain-containing protein n=1 Tax=Collimonas silvisoli TaxID=2825884 RepID=UPI001B8B234C|nr:GGDEF domain-containing protein [Collimonas silvisoli]
MPLNRLFWLISILLMLLFLTLIGRIVSSEWSAYQRSTTSIPAIKSFQLALMVEEKLTAERGPTNTLLRQKSDDAARELARLERLRGASDQALASLRQALQAQAAPWLAPVIAHVKSTERALAAARIRVDFLLAQPTPQRDTEAVGAAVAMMAQSVDAIAPAIAALSGIAAQADPQFRDGLDSARLTSSLRNIAGRMGAIFVAPVVAHRPLTAHEIYTFAKLSGQIEQLYSVIELQLHAYRHKPAFKTALDTVRDQYLEGGLDLLNELLAIGRHSGNYGMNAHELSARYVPRMAAIPHLRDLIVEEMLARAEYRSKQAAYFLLAVSALAAVAMAIFVLLMWVIRQRVLRPILDATALFVSLADERLGTAIPSPRYDDEIGAMMRAIRVLKARSLDKIRLEKQREAMIAQLQTLSDTDFLTGLLNRRAFFAQGEQQFGIAQRYRRQLTLILMDVDHFKTVNDQYGHQAGDQVLRVVAELCRRNRRKVDLLARYGGEEFLLMLPEIDLSQGLAVAEKLRRAIDARHFHLDDGVMVKVTASFGVAAFEQDNNLESLIARADGALYRAKNGGRNTVVTCTQEVASTPCAPSSVAPLHGVGGVGE